MAFLILKVDFEKHPRVSVLTTDITAGFCPTNSQSEREISLEVVHAI